MNRSRDDLPDPERELLGLPPALTPEEEAAQEKEDAEKREDRRLFLYRLMNDPDFRGWLWGKLVDFGVFENRFMASPTGFPDPNASMFQAGMKAAAWALWEEFDNAAPELASQMRREGQGVAPLAVAPRRPRRQRKRGVIIAPDSTETD